MTDFTNPDVKARLTEALDQVRSQIEDIPIVIGGQEFRTDDVQYQQIVSFANYVQFSLLQT